MATAIDVREITKNYAGEHALRGLSFSVPSGSIFGIVGADGAGKTTTMRILATLINPDSGSASVLGHDVKSHLSKIRESIGYMPQKFSLYQDLSVRENLLFFADVFGVGAKERGERMKRLLSFSRLGPFVNRRAANLSGGMKQKLALSCALIHTPEVLLLDEPTTGVDPISRKEFWDILKDLRSQGITILISTPYMDEAHLCDALLFMHKGESILEGTPEQLLAAYPLSLYRIWQDAGTVFCPQDTELPEGIEMLYPSGGTIHAAAARDLTKEEIFRRVKPILPQSQHIAAVAANIEDLLFLTLARKERAHDK
jgi:ABC-2 type transport system ATP-binding protein